MRIRDSIALLFTPAFLLAFSSPLFSQVCEEPGCMPSLESTVILQEILRVGERIQDRTAGIAGGGEQRTATEEQAEAELRSWIRSVRHELAELDSVSRALDRREAELIRRELHALELEVRNLELAEETGMRPPWSLLRFGPDSQSMPLSPKVAPANDDCANATNIGNGTFFGDTSEATNDGTASCGGSFSSQDIWFRYTVPADGEISINTKGSDYDTVLSVHTGCPGVIANEIACNDTTLSPSISSVDLGSVSGGSVFLVRVSGSFGATGSVTLNVGPPTGISGTVTRQADGTPIAGASIDIRDDDGFFIAFGPTDAFGDYQVSGLDPGNYFVSTFNDSGFIDELYDDVVCPVGNCSISGGDPVGVTQDVVTTGIDFALVEGGSISGTVTDASTGNPIASVFVQFIDGQGRFVGNGFTAAGGTYSTFSGLPTGSYFGFTFNSLGFIDELYDDILCLSCDRTTGTPIAVTSPNDTPDIDFALDPGGSISGTITDASTDAPLPSIDIDVFDDQGNFISNGAFTDSSGNYSVVGLPTGTYFVIADPFASQGYIDELYDDIPCVFCDATTGTPVSVTVPNDTSGIDFGLVKPGSLSGTVTEAATGFPIEFVFIRVQDSLGNFLAGVNTAADGTYTVSGLPPLNVYAIAFSGFADELFDDVPCPNGVCDLSTGTPITIVPDADTPNIDFALEAAGFISGRVTVAATGLPLPGVAVSVFDSAGNLVGFDITDFSGFYFAFDLVGGNYFATTTNTVGLEDELFQDLPCPGGACDPTTGTAIVVTPGFTTPGIDFGLGPEGIPIFEDGFESGNLSAWSGFM